MTPPSPGWLSGDLVRWGLAGTLAVAALLPLSCGQKTDSSVLARVGFSTISADQFRQQMALRGGARPETLDKQALLEEMIEQEALYVRAIQAGLDKDPELQRAWRNLLIGKLKERELAPRLAKADVTQPELEAAYVRAQDRYTRPAAVRLAVLYLGVNPVMKQEEIAELRQRMTGARQKALAQGTSNGPGFGALAISCSEDQATRYHGGIVGWVETNRAPAWLGPVPVEAGFALKHQGDLSDVITDSRGVYLLKLLDRREASVIPLAEVSASLRQQLLVEKRRQVEQAFLRESRQSVTIESHPELLARLTLPTSPTVAKTPQPPAFP